MLTVLPQRVQVSIDKVDPSLLYDLNDIELPSHVMSHKLMLDPILKFPKIESELPNLAWLLNDSDDPK
jgi:hypothetical protein